MELKKVEPKKARSAKLLDEIIEQIAKEENISIKKVNCILQSVFGQIAADIRSTTLKGSHVMYLGKFLVKPYNINRFYKHQEIKDNKEDGSNTESQG